MAIDLNLALKQKNITLIRQRDALLYRMSWYRESYSIEVKNVQVLSPTHAVQTSTILHVDR